MSNAIRIAHSIPGRIRFKIPDIRFKAGEAKRYEDSLNLLRGVLWTGGNPGTASLIVRYDPEQISRKQVLEALDYKRTSIVQVSRERAAAPSRRSRARRSRAVPTHVPGWGLARFIGLTALVGGVAIKEIILKKPASQALFSPLGLLVSLAAVPLIKKGLDSIRQGRLTLESFLGGGVMAATAAGQATAALEILWITSGGELLQDWVTERSRRAIGDIVKVTEKNAYILKEGVEAALPVDQIRPGDVVVLHTGEKISVDGEIVKGEAVIDDSPITGRAAPTLSSRGDKVFAGSLVRQGVIFVEAQKVGDQAYLARILTMVENSLENKAPIQGLADRLAERMVGLGLVATLAALAATGSAWRAFTVMLVMACPCATILAASTALGAAINAAARRGILIKGGCYLEEAGRANVICFDKTGTLTTNRPELRGLINFNGFPENELLRLAYSSEIHNSHPLALTIKNEAEKRGITPIHHEICEYFLGKGVRSEIQGDEILVGSRKLMEQFSVDPEFVAKHAETSEQQGLTLIYLAKNRELIGAAGFANKDRADVVEVLSRLRRDGFKKTVMITGDSKYSALEMADRLKFDECRYSVLPEEKADIVAALRSNGDKVLMVGDGINDALALAEADIGVAMGTGGSEAAVEAADIALVQDDLKGVVYVRALGRETIRVIHQHFWIAAGSNLAGVVLGTAGLLSPAAAGLVHIGHTLGVLLNSSRLLLFEPPESTPRDLNPPSDQAVGGTSTTDRSRAGRRPQAQHA
ncbi:MAG: cation-translocating P-type ATPase [Pseudomonadota bacterium]